MYRFLVLIFLIQFSVFSVRPASQVSNLVKVEQGRMYQKGTPLRVGIVNLPSSNLKKEICGYSGSTIKQIHQVLNELGYHYTYKVDTQFALLSELQNNNFDLVFCVPKNNQVHPMILYSMPYADIEIVEAGSEDFSPVYLTACTSIQHHDLMKKINGVFFKRNSSYHLSYLQDHWFGVTVYFYEYLKLQKILNGLFVVCVVLFVFLALVFFRVSYISIDSHNKTRYLLAVLNKFPVPVYILEQLGGDIRYTYLNDVAKSDQFARRENCDLGLLKQHKNRLKNACKLVLDTRDTASFVDRRIKKIPYTVYVSSCMFQGKPRVIKTVVDTKEILVLTEIAENNSKMKDEFLANISHEVRTPLNSILGFCQLLPEFPKDERSAALEIIEKKSKQLHKLINDILLLSKFESKEIQINLTEVNNYEWLLSIIDRVHEELDTPSQVPVEYVHHDCSKAVSIDKELLYIVLSNLLQNAIKFTPKGKVQVGCTYVPEYNVYYVQDTGLGMTKDECLKIFNRFVKLNTFTQGTGLGLPIVQRIVEILHGHLGIYSIPGEGTICYFCYPNPNSHMNSISDKSPSVLSHLKDSVWVGSPPNIEL